MEKLSKRKFLIHQDFQDKYTYLKFYLRSCNHETKSNEEIFNLYIDSKKENNPLIMNHFQYQKLKDKVLRKMPDKLAENIRKCLFQKFKEIKK